MPFKRYKQRGDKWYVYEITSFWDKTLKKSRQRSKYLGVAIEPGGSYSKIDSLPACSILKEQAIVDFGDSYTIFEITKQSGLSSIITQSLGHSDSIMALLCFQMTEGAAMMHAADWLEGNIAKQLFPKAKLHSQAISQLLQHLGEESIQQSFFKAYASKFFQGKHGVLIDSTALPNAINSSLNAFGYSSDGILQKVSCLMLVDKQTKLPLYFRAIPGDIADVSTIDTTLKEIKQLGISVGEVILDAGYFSEANVKSLCQADIDFVSRMPKSRKVFQNLVQQAGVMETHAQAVLYGKRLVFIKSQEITLYGQKLFAHVILDPHKKAKDLNLLLAEAFEDSKPESDINDSMKICGYFILISRKNISLTEILPTYYARQSIEQVFGFAKSCLGALPLRVHSDQSVRGYLLLVFLALVIFITIRQKLQPHYTAECALMVLRSLKAKTFDSAIVIQEPSKKVKSIFKYLGVIVPTELGI